jgi:hypothetical protein
MKEKIVLVVLISIIINLIGLDVWVYVKNREVKTENKTTEVVDNKTDEEVLNKRITDLETEVADLKLASNSSKTETKEVSIASTVNTKSRHVSYVPISGGFSQIAYDWTDVPASQFYFEKSDYPGLKEIKLESNMKLFNGNGKAFVRLFDVTHGVALSGSQVETSSQSDTVVTSEAINFMNGKSLIKVQIKSLTADTTVFNSGRLVITSEY